MKIAVLPQDDKSRNKPFYSLLVGLGYTQYIIINYFHYFFYFYFLIIFITIILKGDIFCVVCLRWK